MYVVRQTKFTKLGVEPDLKYGMLEDLKRK